MWQWGKERNKRVFGVEIKGGLDLMGMTIGLAQMQHVSLAIEDKALSFWS
jgi:hypothetical protein